MTCPALRAGRDHTVSGKERRLSNLAASRTIHLHQNGGQHGAPSDDALNAHLQDPAEGGVIPTEFTRRLKRVTGGLNMGVSRPTGWREAFKVVQGYTPS